MNTANASEIIALYSFVSEEVYTHSTAINGIAYLSDSVPALASCSGVIMEAANELNLKAGCRRRR